jgi:hypothetical protein
MVGSQTQDAAVVAVPETRAVRARPLRRWALLPVPADGSWAIVRQPGGVRSGQFGAADER